MAQPLLPPEENISDAERIFIAESPPGLWPENQDSNFGALRKVLTGPVQAQADLVDALFVEMFLATTNGYLALWEAEYGLPINPPNFAVDFRRFLLMLRARKGPWTRTFRAQIIEGMIRGTYGFALEITYDGIPIPPEGLLFVSDDVLPDFTYGMPITPEGLVLDDSGVPLESSYYVIENIPGQSYHVGIRPDFAPDMDLLNRELARATPAGISFTTAIEA